MTTSQNNINVETASQYKVVYELRPWLFGLLTHKVEVKAEEMEKYVVIDTNEPVKVILNGELLE